MKNKTYPVGNINTLNEEISLYIDFSWIDDSVGIISLHDGVSPRMPISVVDISGFNDWDDVDEMLSPMLDGIEDFIEEYLNEYHKELPV